MQTGSGPGDVTTLRDYLDVVRRRRWVIAVILVVIPALALAASLRQGTLYEASARVLLSKQNLSAVLTDTIDPSANQQPDRIIQTQALLAAAPAVAKRALQAAGVSERSPQELLKASTVSAKGDTDIVQFNVRDSNPHLARRLATAYAREFTDYRRDLDTAALKRAGSGLERRINELSLTGDRTSDLYGALVEKQEQLRTMEALQTGNVVLVRAADEAWQVQPRPVYALVLGFGLALIFGVLIAFILDALDTRVRTAEEISTRLGLPLLARLTEPERQLRSSGQLATIAAPHGPQGEAFRILRSNLDFVNMERGARIVMVTSAVEREGKSTTVANLAVTLARAGRRVGLVDLDLRRPVVADLFGVKKSPGLTSVAVGDATLDEALVSVAITDTDHNENGNRNGNGNGASLLRGFLEILPSGPPPPDPGEFVGTRRLNAILRELADRYDILLIDAPPLLRVGDALTLTSAIDALFVCARLKVVRRPMLTELRRVLDSCPVPTVGLVVTGLEAGADSSYGGYYAYEPQSEAKVGVS